MYLGKPCQTAQQFIRRKYLPYDAEVEYLESTGTQYIDTGIQLANDAGFIIDFISLDVSNNTTASYPVIAGAQMSDWSAWLTVYADGYTAEYRNVTVGNPNRFVSGHANVRSIARCNYLNDNKAFFQRTGDAASEETLGPMSSIPANVMLFASGIEVSPGYSDISKARVFSFKLSIGQTVMMDLIPVRFTNELGQSEGAMYDKVSWRLFRNVGTGNFIVGRDINPISARSYVNDGLIAMWDGIENAGWGVHDAAPTAWTDLIGNCHLNDLFVDSAYSPTSGFGDNYWWFTGGMSRWRKQNATITYKTAELVSFQPNEQYTSFCGGSGNYNIGGYFASVVMGSSSSPYPSISRNTDFISVYSYTIGTEGDSSTYTTYRDGLLISMGVIGAGNNHVTDEVAIGTVVRRQLFVTPRIYCVRLYSRVLTATEIATNYAVDKVRFNLS